MGFIFESLLLEVGTLIACILSLVYVYFKRSFTYRKKRNDFMQLLIQLKNKGVVDSEQEAENQNDVTPNGDTETAEVFNGLQQ
jgi:hypothetical protein